MIVKIFNEQPLSYGLYKTLPEELENVEGLIYEPTQEEIEIINSNKPTMFVNGRIVIDTEEEQKRLERREKVKRKNEIQSNMNILLNWFVDYDKAVAQFERKKYLFENGFISLEIFNLEKDKILQLHLAAEEKAKELNRLREEMERV